MPVDKINEIRIRLKTIDALFATPEINPFDPDTRYISGIDELVQQLTAMKLRHSKTRVIINLPAQAMRPGLKEKTQAAIARYCNVQIKSAMGDIDQLRRQGRFSLVSAVIIISVAIGLVTLISWLDIFNGTLATFVTAGLSVFSWVAVWEPFNIYLYYWRIPARTRRLFEHLQQAELVIEADK